MITANNFIKRLTRDELEFMIYQYSLMEANEDFAVQMDVLKNQRRLALVYLKNDDYIINPKKKKG